MAGPAGGASGTEAGGTGGGRSEKSWADAESEQSPTASKSTAPSHLARPLPATSLPLQIMAMLFTENAANSSLRSPIGHLMEP